MADLYSVVLGLRCLEFSGDEFLEKFGAQ